ncbi:MAG: peptidoglycan bridge formation glycyltransferase FemA/FemB family protein [Anaerolineae bacterium]|nr:peptidoglycan bridge formation glycyltransferase FemA/FemB family protein [Anaerolineae bacterium]
MSYSVVTPTPADWDAFIRPHPRAHLLQLAAWGDHQAQSGWQVARLALAEQGQIVAGAQVLFAPLPGRIFWRAYVPFGGLVTADAQMPALWQAVRRLAVRRRAAWLKWEPGFYLHTPPPDFARLGFRPSPQTIQPPRTILLDITGSEDSLLARMNQGTRRKIRQAQKNAIRYYEATAAEVPRFTRMLLATGARNEFGLHPPEYYARAWAQFAPAGDATLILAEHEGDDLAGIMVFGVGSTAVYLYGASASLKRNLMAAYGVQWAAIQWARARGCTHYDMWGIPDEDETTLEAQFQTREDGLWGVYGFKRGWGGQVVRSAGAWDMVYNPPVYAAYQWLQRRRRG